jgi:hypothetical protein
MTVNEPGREQGKCVRANVVDGEDLAIDHEQSNSQIAKLDAHWFTFRQLCRGA